MTDEETKNTEKMTKTLASFTEAGVKLYEACKMQQKLIVDMMPGVANIALQDYALLNEAPIAATKAINNMEAVALQAGKDFG